MRTINLTLKIIQFDKAVDIDEYLVKHCGTDHEKKKEKFEALKKNAKQHMMLLRNQIKLYKNAIEDRNENADPGNKIKPNNIFIGKICAEYFKYAGAYFVESENNYRCNIFYENYIYELSDNPIFNAMMNRTAGLNASQNGFKIIRQEMTDTAINTGKKVKIPGWITAKRTTNTIFINLCNERNELLKLSPGEIEIIKNGSNQDSVYLRNASNMEEINPDLFEDETYIKEGMSEMKTLLFDNFPCALVNKYYLFVYMIASFFVNFFKAKGLLKASGDTGSGKTTAANIITHLIYKKDMTTIGTPASYFTEAAISPITVMDNYERQNIDKSILDFLLFVATGGNKMKRDRDRQTSNIFERASTQIYWTAIEPPEKEELINRTIDIQFNERYWKEDFLETEITDLIIEKRDKLLSTIFKLIAFKILPDFKNKHSKAIKWLNSRFKGHSKKRLNEMLATYSVILKEVCNYIPYTEGEEGVASHVAIVSKWIEIQNEIAKDVSINTDPVIRYVGYLLNAYKYDETEFKTNFPEIQVEPELTEIAISDHSIKEYKSISFDFKYDDLYTFIGMESKRIGEKNPFTSSGNLKSGLRKANKTLKSAGWNFEGEVKEKRNSHYRIYRLTKTFKLEPEPF
ncbi:MAG: hypothetical protein OMM_04876 [Candidatus Magnetoglobus multicellularis str. Araruama]|uniref:DUF927 domain-containing protein n=1 Tax=Candidatus Magnetoglobus multicellularis str. Araruama TaxID=890399 RepID=A0A1V1NZE0_9BACT|nr:MAG: hypothetical protein OMM_04876 [Candidatus Magnetoglobus multicellularis str. Araruama]